MKAQKLILGLVALVVLLFAASASAVVPQMINYQGVLTDTTGCPKDGNFDMTFRVYDVPTGRTALWEKTYDNVTVIQGKFDVVLGDINPIPYSLFLNDSLWLAVKVEGDDEMTPRQRINSVGYAFQAEYADTADYARNGPGIADDDWTFRITDTADTTLFTGGTWGIARYGNVLYGNTDSTHVNLGVACTTGINGFNYKYCTVGGGWANAAAFDNATVGGGWNNTADGPYAAVGGGAGNTASYNATVGGGLYNHASGIYATVGGGKENAASAGEATVGGGQGNIASSQYASVGGGTGNTASGLVATVAGGNGNTASGGNAFVGGGGDNTASGTLATVSGGSANTASGDYSFAAGRRAKANHHGTFTWGDNTDEDFASTADNQFLIRASGGVGIGTTSPTQELEVAGTVRMTGFELPTGASTGKVLTSDAFGEGTWETAPGGVGGSGTTNYVAKFTGTTTIGNSAIFDTGGNVGIGTDDPDARLHILDTTANAWAVIGMAEGGSGTKYGGRFLAVNHGYENIGLYTRGGCLGLPAHPASRSNIGIWAEDGSSGGILTVPLGNWAGCFNGDVRISGDLELKGGVKFEYDSTFSISVGGTKTLTHNLGGDSTKYIVTMYGISSSGGVHQANYGTNYLPVNKWIGCEWDQLTSTTIRVTRAANDDETVASKQWNQVILRILKNQ